MRKNRLPYWEFIVLVSIMFGMIAFGTDTMLPAFPKIADDLELLNVNQAQLIISSFILGTGIGQLISGPISDTFGRKPIITIGLVIFIISCVVAYYAKSLEMMLFARFVQGLGVSAPRTVTMALIRDLYSGRKMAQVMSLAMAIFVLVPALAPSLGQVLFIKFGWRSIYIAFIIFALLGLLNLVLSGLCHHRPLIFLHLWLSLPASPVLLCQMDLHLNHLLDVLLVLPCSPQRLGVLL